MTKTVFVSYARKDQSEVMRIAQILEDNGLEVWLDSKSIAPGHPWAKAIMDGLESCDVLLAVHSQASVNHSYQCKGEWLHAQDLGRFIIPVIIDPGTTIHSILDNIQAINLTTDYDVEMGRLLKAIDSGHSEQPRKVHYTLLNSGEPREFPFFYNQDKASYSNFIANSQHIRIVGSTGWLVFSGNHQISFEEMLVHGGKLDIVLSQPTLENFTRMAYWSAWMDDEGNQLDDVRKKIQRVAQNTANGLRDLQRRFPNAITLKLMDFPASIPMIQFDPETPSGRIILGIYSFRRSIDQRTLRPGTVLTPRNFPDLYEHFRVIYNNMWKESVTISIDSYMQEE